LINFRNSGVKSASNRAGGCAMSNTAARLELYGAILSLIERKRAESGDESLGEAIERLVLDSQVRELETDILEDPGAFEPWLIRRRRES
jgi:hypothetical protein